MRSITQISNDFAKDDTRILSFSVCETFILATKTVDGITLDMVFEQKSYDEIENIHTFPFGRARTKNIISFLENTEWENYVG